MYRYTRAALVVALLALSVAACRKKPVVTPVDSSRTPVVVSDPGPRGGGSGNPVVAPTENRAELEAAIKRTEVSLAATIYFDYDVAELSMAARSLLDTKAQIMRDNPDVMIRVEGNCDSRGSNEYNIALGQRRAAAAREYLVGRGIAATRIQTVSLGEEKPAMQGETEASWSKNRRDEFITTAGKVTKPLGD